MKHQSALWSLLALPAFMIPLSSCTGDNVLTIAEVTHSIFYAPQYVAIENGYFKEEGLNVELLSTPGADKTMAALLSGEADIGLMGPEASVYVYQGGEKNYAVNFAQLTQKDGSFLLARDPIENFDFSMLKGKTIIGGRKGGMPEMTLEYVLKKQGLDIGRDEDGHDVKIRTDVSFDVMAGVFTAGQSDFVTLFEPSATKVEQNGIGHIVASIGAYSGEVPYTCYSMTKNSLAKNTEIAKKFTRAIQRGIDYVYSASIDDLVKSLKPSFSSSSDEEIARVMQNYLSIEAWPKTLEMKESSYQRLLEILTLAEQLDGPAAPFEKIMTNQYLSSL